jgi:hypothetical protein
MHWSRTLLVASCCVVGGLLSCRATRAEEPAAKAPPCRVAVDPRVELACIIFRLAGYEEYNRGDVKAYNDDVDKHFGPLHDHAVVKLARKVRGTRSVGYDACMSMAIHLGDLHTIKEDTVFRPLPKTLDARWTPGDARAFAVAAAQFAKDTSFDEFTKQHRGLYEQTESRMRAMLEKDAHLEWFNDFFGARSGVTFVAVPGLLNGGNCYGVRCPTADGREELYCILGVWATDEEGMPTFGRGMVGTVVHEFCHSYSNAIIDRHADELQSAGEKMFPHVAKQMQSQAYGNWKTMLYESLVRACTLRHARRYGGVLATWMATQNEKGRGFAWAGELSDLLGEYEAHRDKYPTLEAFAPRLVAFFNDYAKKYDREQTALDAKRPQVVSITPADGTEDVDPGLKSIRVVFDRPMRDNSWSLCGGGPHFPELVGKPSYDAKRTTWTVRVKLKPDWSYEFALNAGRFTGFQSEEGVPLAPVDVEFKTVKETNEQ